MKKALIAVFVLSVVFLAGQSKAGIKVYQDGDKFVEIGGRIQLQYHQENDDPGDVEDELFFRRLRPYITGSLHKNWVGKFEFEMGKASDDNELAVKGAYIEYKGIENLNVIIGHVDAQFSREVLTSSKKQQLIERTFVGDHNYGTPDKSLGLHVTGALLDKKITYGLSLASLSLDPDAKKLDFDSPVNKSVDWNEGHLAAGRIDFHPLGNVAFSQGDFDRDVKFVVGVAGLAWSNDGDNNTYTDPVDGITAIKEDKSVWPFVEGPCAPACSKADVDSVKGTEISAGIRGYGISIDIQQNEFKAELYDVNITDGIYENGKTKLKNFSVEGGVMLIPSVVELVGGYQWQDADNYGEKWQRTSVGLNYYVHKHDLKTQITFRNGKSVDGVNGEDKKELFVQTQLLF